MRTVNVIIRLVICCNIIKGGSKLRNIRLNNRKKCLALITARGGSKGIERKNVRPLGGRPLIEWTIEAALKSDFVDQILVSTDDEEIAAVSEKAGVRVPFVRPSQLSGNNASHIDTVLHGVAWAEENDRVLYDYVLLLQPTLPFRTHTDIDEAGALIISKKVSSVVGICEVDVHPTLLKQMSEDLTIENYYNESIVKDMRRQDCSATYRINGAIYLCSVDFLKANNSWYSTDTVGHLMPASRSVDIDTEFDLLFANFLALELSL